MDDTRDGGSTHGRSDTSLANEGLDQTKNDPLMEDEEYKTGAPEVIQEENESSNSSQSPPAGHFIVDPSGDNTHDQTTVDIVTVPCPGADPLRTWTRDGLMSRCFGALSMRDAQAADPTRPVPSWARQGIRREADMARILLYEHPPLEHGVSLACLADALLEALGKAREGQEERPVVFVGHSIGGIIAKMVLVKASRDVRFERILRQTYGIAFFGKLSLRVGLSKKLTMC